MPVVKLTVDRISTLVGIHLTLDELEEKIPWLGVHIEEKGEDWIRIEYNPNRPDLSSQEGVARSLKGLLEIKVGLPEYRILKGNVSLLVDESVKSVRPCIVGAVCRNLKLSNSIIEELMAAQEDIHWAVGRDRRKASIGLHDLENVVPPFTYIAIDPKSIRFTPLGADEPLDLEEILSTHPKGIAYRHLVKKSAKLPVIVDKNRQVLSFPPIINGTVTQVTEETRNMFIDVTGTLPNAVNNALNLIVTQLAETGCDLESITILEDKKKTLMPDLTPKKLSLSAKYVNRVLGLQLTPEEIIRSIRKERFDATPLSEDRILVTVPAYRIDVLHEIDLVDEVAVGYGYYNIQPRLPSRMTIGRLDDEKKLESLARRLMIGLGYQEVVNFTLTNEAEHHDCMRIKGSHAIRILNPVSSEYNILRESLLPGLLRTLRVNKHERLPQRIFEIGQVLLENSESETGVSQRTHIAAASTHSTANFAEIVSVFTALINGLSSRIGQVTLSQKEHASYIPGRVAGVSRPDREIAILGEIHPEVITNFGLEHPVAAFEVDIEPFFIRRKIR